MKVVEVMSRGVDPVPSSANVQEAATRMAELDVGAVLVGAQEALEGILTDRDIILRVVVDGRAPADVLVRDVMSSTLYSCRADDPVELALQEMRERQIRRLPVYDEDGQAVGIVTLGDLARAVDGPEQIKETFRDIAEPHRSRRAQQKEKAAEAADAAEAEKSDKTGELS